MYDFKTIHDAYKLITNNTDKLPGFILLYGEEGNAALEVALSFIKLINCDRHGDNPCEVCNNCTMITQMTHPDARFVFPNIKSDTDSGYDPSVFLNTIRQNPFLDCHTWKQKINCENKQLVISKDDIQQTINYMSLQPVMSRYKISVIWLAEYMNHNAANSLLKILEEPIDNTIFIMITNNVYTILPTIISRAVKIHIPQCSYDELYLLAHSINPQMNEHELNILVRSTHGNASMLFSTETHDHWEIFIKWMRSLYKNDYTGIFNVINELHSLGKENVKSFLIYCSEIFQQMFYISNNVNDLVYLQNEQLTTVHKLSKMLANDTIIANQKELDRVHYEISRNANVKLCLFSINPFNCK